MSNDLVTVATFLNSSEAGFAKSHLEAEGIKAFLEGEHTVTMDWLLGNAVRWIKLQVSSDDAERAIDILNEKDMVDGRSLAAQAQRELEKSQGEAESETDVLATDEEEYVLTQREKDADKALQGAVIGLCMPFIQPFIFWILLRILFSSERLGPNKRWKVIVAALINILFMMLVGIFLSEFIRLALGTNDWIQPKHPLRVPPRPPYSEDY